MRENKFRAWNHEDKEMLSDIHDGMMIQMNSGQLGFYDDEGTFQPCRYSLMQYTGLKDKNGKEVYDKDIVRCSSGCPHVIEWRDEIGGKYGGGMPGWYLSGLLSGYGEGYAWTGREEIIGNMYQNPELFKETK